MAAALDTRNILARKQGSTGGMNQETPVALNQAAPEAEEKMTLGALQVMVDLWKTKAAQDQQREGDV